MNSASSWSDVANELRENPLYVDPDAQAELETGGFTFDDRVQDAVLDALSDTSTDVYVAVVPGARTDSEASATLTRELGGASVLVLFGNTDFSAGPATSTADARWRNSLLTTIPATSKPGPSRSSKLPTNMPPPVKRSRLMVPPTGPVDGWHSASSPRSAGAGS